MDMKTTPRDHPKGRKPVPFLEAGEGTRTPNLLITNQLLYQLSYASALVAT